MESFRCYDNSDVIATLVMTIFHLNTTVVAIFPNVCLWRRSLCSDLVLTLKNCIEPPSYARTAYVVAIWPSFLVYSFVKIWATCEMFLGKWFTAPPGKKFPVGLCLCRTRILCSTLIRVALLLEIHVLFPAVPTKTMVHAVALTVFLPFLVKDPFV